MSRLQPYIEVREKLTLKEKVGQLFMPAAFINDTEDEIEILENLIQKYHIGGLCFFHSRASAATNYEGKKKIPYNADSFTTLRNLIHRYQSMAKYPLVIAMDAEWGLAMRVENTPQYPYAICLGAIDEADDLIFEVGRHIARDCKYAGIHWNLSPVVDVNDNPDNPVIGYRSFGGDRERVAKKALAYVRGTQREGVLTSIKHFPGHGDTATDSHLGLPLITKSKQELVTNELYPFQKLIDAGVDSVMVGHLSVPALAQDQQTPSSISKDIIYGILRKEMGFEGVVISDALNMHAVSKNYPIKGMLEWLAFDAGNDVLCFSEHPVEGMSIINERATPQQIEDSFHRVWTLKERAFTTKEEVSELSLPEDLNGKIAKESLTLVRGTENTLLEIKTRPFSGVSLFQTRDIPFFNAIQAVIPFKEYSNNDHSIEEITQELVHESQLLLAVFPPQIKPTHNFGISEIEIAFINTLIRTKNVVLYIFGNPYILNQIDSRNAKAVVLAYQNFASFQVVAADHFLGLFKAKGIVPVDLKEY